MGVSDHMPIDQAAYLPKEEAAEGFTMETLHQRFHDHSQKVTDPKSPFEGNLGIYFDFKTEVYPGRESYLENLLS